MGIGGGAPRRQAHSLCQLDHAAAHPCIAGSGQSPFAALASTFIWRACQAAVARHPPLIPQLTREEASTALKRCSDWPCYKVGLGVIADNIINIGTALAKRSAEAKEQAHSKHTAR
jgi:hypothetical protein